MTSLQLLLFVPCCLLLLPSGCLAIPVQLSQVPVPSGLVLVQQDPGLGKLLMAQPASPSAVCPPCPPCPPSTAARAPPLFYYAPAAARTPSQSPIVLPCPTYDGGAASAVAANMARQRVKRSCCCCCCKPCCCCCCKPCCCGCALNICVKPSCCCKCCPTCQCCTGYGCKKRRKRALPLSPLIESMPMLTRPLGEMKYMKRG